MGIATLQALATPGAATHPLLRHLPLLRDVASAAAYALVQRATTTAPSRWPNGRSQPRDPAMPDLSTRGERWRSPCCASGGRPPPSPLMRPAGRLRPPPDGRREARF